MPIYEYSCSNCLHTFDLQVKMDDAEAVQRCPNCGETQTRRLLSTFVAFSSSGGQRRMIAGSNSCSGCQSTGNGCSSCNLV